MNLLKSTTINGEIFFEYAFLTFDFCFKNESSAAMSTDYIFALPSGAVISGASFVCNDGKPIKTSVVSVTHAAKLCAGPVSTAILRRLDKTTYIFSIGDLGIGVGELRLKVYVPLLHKGTERSLNIPLAFGCGGVNRSNASASISLYLHGEKEGVTGYKSPTHKLYKGTLGELVEVTTGNILADRDFCLRIADVSRKSSVVAEQDNYGGMLLCRLYPFTELKNQCDVKYKKLLFILDATGSLLYGATKAAFEILRHIAKAHNGEFAVVIAQDSPVMLTDGYCLATPENISGLIEKLSRINNGGGSLAEAIDYASKVEESDTMTILISGTRFTEGLIVAEEAAKSYEGKVLNIITLGSSDRSRDVDELLAVCGGRREHIFGEDNIPARAQEVLSRFGSPNYWHAKVSIDGTRAEVISTSDDGITVFAKYTGERIPQEAVVKFGAVEQRIRMEEINVYQKFAPIGLVYADFLYTRLERELEKCSSEDICGIRQLMEEVGIKYSAVNSETALATVIDGSRSAMVRVCIPNSGCNSYDVFLERKMIIGESDSVNIHETERAEIFEGCLDILLKSMRADGAVCSDGEINPILRKQQTLVALLAVVASGKAEKNTKFVERAKLYINNFEYLGMKFTQNIVHAKEQLAKLWGGNCVLQQGMVPDLLTAAKIVSQWG